MEDLGILYNFNCRHAVEKEEFYSYRRYDGGFVVVNELSEVSVLEQAVCQDVDGCIYSLERDAVEVCDFLNGKKDQHRRYY
jgi:hypothetical protein